MNSELECEVNEWWTCKQWEVQRRSLVSKGATSHWQTWQDQCLHIYMLEIELERTVVVPATSLCLPVASQTCSLKWARKGRSWYSPAYKIIEMFHGICGIYCCWKQESISHVAGVNHASVFCSSVKTSQHTTQIVVLGTWSHSQGFFFVCSRLHLSNHKSTVLSLVLNWS